MRVKVIFDDAVSSACPRAVVEVKESLKNVKQFMQHLKKLFKCKGSIQIELDGFLLPHFENVQTILEKDDVITVKVDNVQTNLQIENDNKGVKRIAEEELNENDAKKAKSILQQKKEELVKQADAVKVGAVSNTNMDSDSDSGSDESDEEVVQASVVSSNNTQIENVVSSDSDDSSESESEVEENKTDYMNEDKVKFVRPAVQTSQPQISGTIQAEEKIIDSDSSDSSSDEDEDENNVVQQTQKSPVEKATDKNFVWPTEFNWRAVTHYPEVGSLVKYRTMDFDAENGGGPCLSEWKIVRIVSEGDDDGTVTTTNQQGMHDVLEMDRMLQVQIHKIPKSEKAKVEAQIVEEENSKIVEEETKQSTIQENIMKKVKEIENQKIVDEQSTSAQNNSNTTNEIVLDQDRMFQHPILGDVHIPENSDAQKFVQTRLTRLTRAVSRQVHYYLGESNWKKDKFLRAKADSDGWLCLKMLGGFNRMRSLTTNIEFIASTLVDSKELEVSEDKMSVRRKSATAVE